MRADRTFSYACRPDSLLRSPTQCSPYACQPNSLLRAPTEHDSTCAKRRFYTHRPGFLLLTRTGLNILGARQLDFCCQRYRAECSHHSARPCRVPMFLSGSRGQCLILRWATLPIFYAASSVFPMQVHGRPNRNLGQRS